MRDRRWDLLATPTTFELNFRITPRMDLLIRYAANPNHSIVVTIVRKTDAWSHYMEERVAKLDEKSRRKELISFLQLNEETGDTNINNLPVFTQGMRPYCAVNTLGMVTHHLGLRLSVNGLAAGAQFKNTGSAKGSKMLQLYEAAAQEANSEVDSCG